MSMSRMIFYHNGDENYEIKAGGVIFYHNGELMMILKKGKIEDFGGKTDEFDKSIYDTVGREVEEESNNIFKKDDIIEMIKGQEYVYNAKSKYALFFIKLDEKIDCSIFGEKEIHDNINRTVIWIPMKDFEKTKKNFRLTYHKVLKKINSLMVYKNNNKDELFITRNYGNNDSYSHVKSKLICKYGLKIKKKRSLMLVTNDNNDSSPIYMENKCTVYDSSKKFKVVSFLDHPNNYMGNLVWDNQIKVYKDYDGVELCLFFADKTWYIHTRKNIYKITSTNKLVNLFKKLLKFDEIKLKLDKKLSYAFAIVFQKGHPMASKYCVFDHDCTQLYHIKTMNRLIEIDLGGCDEFSSIGRLKSFTYPSMMFSSVQSVEQKAKNILNEKGFIICDGHNNRKQIKTQHYISKYEYLYGNRNLDQYVKYLFANNVEEHKYEHEINKLKKKIKDVYKQVKKLDKELDYLNKKKMYKQLKHQDKLTRDIIMHHFYTNQEITKKSIQQYCLSN